MFDPWPDIRKWAKEFRKRGKGGDYAYLTLDETDKLLADADALLRMVPAIKDAHRLLAKVVPADQNDMIRWAVKSGDATYTNAGAAYRGLVEILDALPEQLTHEHDWIDPTNEHVSGGAICLGCGEIRAETPEQLRSIK